MIGFDKLVFVNRKWTARRVTAMRVLARFDATGVPACCNKWRSVSSSVRRSLQMCVQVRNGLGLPVTRTVPTLQHIARLALFHAHVGNDKYMQLLPLPHMRPFMHFEID